jgi:hypothetical protein
VTIRLAALFLVLAAIAAAQATGPERIPEWAEQGRFRFARLDGGPIEILKTARSSWALHFNDAEKEVLGNLYTKYADSMIDLLEQAHVNWVWITYSVGYSWHDEEKQREQCRILIRKLHERKIHVSAYICSATMFWESMFRDEPRSVRWLAYDKDGVPFRYSGGRDALRFVADITNPEWVDYQKRRISAAIDAGVDGFFFDNTASPLWNTNPAMERFIAEMRRYVREDKKSDALLMSNFGLSPERARMSPTMDVHFNELWREPGVFGDLWDVSNIRRMRYVRGIIPEWMPMMSEYSEYHDGNRSTTLMGPRSTRLAIAEAAAFRSSYTWNMEGPFYHRLLTGDAAAAGTWKAIGHYNGFLAEHEELYRNARAVTATNVELSDRSRINFSWNADDTDRLDALAKAGVMYDLKLSKTTSIPAAPASSVTVTGGDHLIANLTTARGKLLLHLLNYEAGPVAGVRVRLKLGHEKMGELRIFTPDAAKCEPTRVRRAPGELEFTLDTLDTYAVVRVE